MDDDYTGVPRLTPHYIVNNLIPNAYTYGTSTGWIPGQQQISSQQTTYMHPIYMKYLFLSSAISTRLRCNATEQF
jgi:hypothetical protein